MKERSTFYLLSLLFFCFGWFGCEPSNPSLACDNTPCHGTFIDVRDGEEYCTINIGTQTWMAENMRYDVPNVWSDSATTDTINPNNPSNKYGRLYDLTTAQTVCPNGWHLPSDMEWKNLEMALGMSQSEADKFDYRGINEADKLKSSVDWLNNRNGLNSICFNALPAGDFQILGTFAFSNIGGFTIFWTSTLDNSSRAYVRILYIINGKIYRTLGSQKHTASSCRCVQD